MNEKILKVIQISDSEDSPDYVGIKVNDGNVEISIPNFLRLENINNPSKRDRDMILMFLRSISIAKSVKEERFKKTKEYGDVWPIESYLWIIDDYIENGVYFNRDKKYYSDNKGKIEWKKTIKNMPIVSNDNIIYDKLITSRTSALDSTITDIYKICLKHSIEKMAWYRDLNINVDIVQTKPVSEMIYHVKKELNNTFDDVKRIRFSHMLKILSLSEEQNISSNNFTYWINNYYYVYEKMIDFLFKGIADKQKENFNPSGAWQINGVDEPKKASNLRPDTIFIKKMNDETEIFIIDAKMYKFGYTANLDDLPETTSIQKQITYGDHIKKEFPNAKVRNAFIIPYNPNYFDEKTKFTLEPVNEKILYVGKAYGKWRKEKEVFDHDNIYTFVIDFNYLLENYRSADSSDIDALCKKIDEYIDSANNQGGQNNE